MTTVTSDVYNTVIGQGIVIEQHVTINRGDMVCFTRDNDTICGQVAKLHCLNTYPVSDQLWNLELIVRELMVQEHTLVVRSSDGYTLVAKDGVDIQYPGHLGDQMIYSGNMLAGGSTWHVWIAFANHGPMPHKQVQRVAFSYDESTGHFIVLDSHGGEIHEHNLDWLQRWYPYIHAKFGETIETIQEMYVSIPDLATAQRYLDEYYNHDGWSDSDAANTPEGMLIAWRAKCAGEWMERHGINRPMFTGELAEAVKAGAKIRHELGDFIDDPDDPAENAAKRIWVEQQGVQLSRTRHSLMARIDDLKWTSVNRYNEAYNNDIYSAARHEGNVEYNNKLISYALALCGHPGYAVDDYFMADLDQAGVEWMELFL